MGLHIPSLSNARERSRASHSSPPQRRKHTVPNVDTVSSSSTESDEIICWTQDTRTSSLRPLDVAERNPLPRRGDAVTVESELDLRVSLVKVRRLVDFELEALRLRLTNFTGRPQTCRSSAA